jgi:hypothetical protein
MAESNPPGRSPARWAVASVLLLIAVASTLVVPIYARSAPKLGAFPFFYWYQLILVPVIAILCGIAYLLVRTRRAAGPDPANSGGAAS